MISTTEALRIARTVGQAWVERCLRQRNTSPVQVAQFQYRLNDGTKVVRRYEDETVQAKARSVVPHTLLEDRAKANMSSEASEAEKRDELMRQLLKWFKQEFFRWVDAPNCDRCQGKTTPIGALQPTPDDLRYGAGRVEGYRCTVCGVSVRFPRYNDPAKLLETRRGRCGEWANCFTLICRALGFDARYVLDWTDHVWTEFYSDNLKRWVHLDSCEAAFDAPLSYEAGWGKKLSYIIAFSLYETVDVTRRYTRQYQDVVTRRNEVPEDWLKRAVDAANARLITVLPHDRQQIVLERRAAELKELSDTTQRALRNQELIGRESGAQEWRQARGELGSVTSAVSSLSFNIPFPQLTTPPLARLDRTLHEPSTICQTFRFNGNLLYAPIQIPSSPPIAAFILTPPESDKKSSTFLRSPLDTSHSLSMEFGFVMASDGADGFAIVLQADSIGALGGGGCEMGYGGIRKSVAIEFDSYASVDRCQDPNGSHVSVHTRGGEPNSAHHDYSIACSSVSKMNDGKVRYVFLSCDCTGKTLGIWMSETSKSGVSEGEVRGNGYRLLVSVPNFDLGNVLVNGYQKDAKNAPTETCWIGFTGATGGLSQLHAVFDVCIWAKPK